MHTLTHTAHTLAMSANKALSVGPMLRHSRGWRTQLPTIWMSSCELMPGSQTRGTARQSSDRETSRVEALWCTEATALRVEVRWALGRSGAQRHAAIERMSRSWSASRRMQRLQRGVLPVMSLIVTTEAQPCAAFCLPPLCIFPRRVCVDRRGSREWHHFWVWDAWSGDAAAR